MATSQARSHLSVSGSLYRDYRKKKKYEHGSVPTMTKLDEPKLKAVRVMGDNRKYKLLRGNVANVYDPKSKKYSKIKIKNILENPANRHFVRRNIITKGTVLDTELGKARVTSRPGQDGAINAVLI
ncbi:MAG: 30S ribosomal protein S8e [Nanoarchaeota archaeon]|nr:30S ribosomal protein S8e [Nanoarchaeota archaeon]